MIRLAALLGKPWIWSFLGAGLVFVAYRERQTRHKWIPLRFIEVLLKTGTSGGEKVIFNATDVKEQAQTGHITRLPITDQ